MNAFLCFVLHILWEYVHYLLCQTGFINLQALDGNMYTNRYLALKWFTNPKPSLLAWDSYSIQMNIFLEEKNKSSHCRSRFLALTSKFHLISLQMLSTVNTGWPMTASPPTRLNWHTTVTDPQEQESWSAGGLLESPVCELLSRLCFPSNHSRCCCYVGLLFRLRTSSPDLCMELLKAQWKNSTFYVKQLPWVSFTVGAERYEVTGLVFVNIKKIYHIFSIHVVKCLYIYYIVNFMPLFLLKLWRDG